MAGSYASEASVRPAGFGRPFGGVMLVHDEGVPEADGSGRAGVGLPFEAQERITPSRHSEDRAGPESEAQAETAPGEAGRAGGDGGPGVAGTPGLGCAAVVGTSLRRRSRTTEIAKVAASPERRALEDRATRPAARVRGFAALFTSTSTTRKRRRRSANRFRPINPRTGGGSGHSTRDASGSSRPGPARASF